MNRALGVAFAAAATFTALPACAQAPSWTAELTAASEYVSKGVGRSRGEPHVGLQVQKRLTGAAYAGAWTGSLRSPLGANAETHLYAGWRSNLSGWSLDARPMLKLLSGADSGARTELLELRVDAARAFGANRLRLRVEHSPEGYGAARSSTWMEASVSRRLDDRWSASATLGRREQAIGLDYTAWSAGLQLRLTEAVSVEARWLDADRGAGREYAGRAFVGLTASFGR